MSHMHRTTGLWALVIAVAIMASSSVAQADVMTYDFFGPCLDCSGAGKAELVLQNYTPGADLESSNFVSFHYDGTNLFNAYTITSGLTSFGGSIPDGLPASASVLVETASLFFESNSNGDWSTGTMTNSRGGSGGHQGADQGVEAMWTSTPSTPPPNTVPEPGTLALLSIGLAGLGLTRRSRKA